MTKVSVESNKNADENQHDLDAMEEMLDSDSDEKSVTEESDHEIDDEESSSADDEESDEGVDGKPLTIATETHGEEICTFDVRNLVAINSHQINSSALYKKKLRGDDDIKTTIHTKGMSLANEKHLLQKASDGCTQLLSKLWKLDTERTDAGLLAALPSYFEIVTPRELVSAQGKYSYLFTPTLSLPLELPIATISATTHSSSRDKMGKVCQRTWNSTERKEVS